MVLIREKRKLQSLKPPRDLNSTHAIYPIGNSIENNSFVPSLLNRPRQIECGCEKKDFN